MGKIADRQLNQSGYVCSQIILNNVVGFHHSHDDLLHAHTHTQSRHKAHIGGYRQQRHRWQRNSQKHRYYVSSSTNITMHIEWDTLSLLTNSHNWNQERRCYHCNFWRFVRFHSISFFSILFFYIYRWRLYRINGIKCGSDGDGGSGGGGRHTQF